MCSSTAFNKRWYVVSLSVALAATAACGTSRDGAAPPDSGIDAAPSTDAGPIIESPGPRIDDVTAGGSHQVRQGDSVEITVTGARLAGATSVTLGELTAGITFASDDRVLVTVEVPHGFEPQKLALTLTTPDGAVTRGDALESTFYVIAADARPHGRGTPDQPMALCDDQVLTVMPGDTLAIGAGVHRCAANLRLPGGIHIAGAGVATTILDGFNGLDIAEGSDQSVTTLTGLSIRTDSSFTRSVRVRTFGGSLLVDGLAVEGPASGITVEESRLLSAGRSVTIRNFQYRGSGNGLTLETAATVSDSTIADCATGITTRDARVMLHDLAVTGCTSGVILTSRFEAPPQPPVLAISDAVLRGNDTGIQIVNGVATLDRVTVDSGPEGDCTTGVLLQRGRLTLEANSRIGCRQLGIHVLADVAGPLTADQGVRIDNAEVAGADVGIQIDETRRLGAQETGSLSSRHSHLDGRRAAVWLVAALASCNLGFPDDPGDNRLTAGSTGFAFRDARRVSGAFPALTFAIGSTLNGHAYTDQRIVGPASLGEDYDLRENVGLEF
jgi:hypothetical protein